MGEETLADKAHEFLSRNTKKDKTKFPYFYRQWEAFEKNLHYILQAQMDRKISADQARELVNLHYEPLKYHPGASERFINSAQKQEFIDAINSIAIKNIEDCPAARNRKYVEQLREEAEFAKAEKKRSLKAGLVTMGAFCVGAGGYELVERDIISGHVMNAVVYGIPGTILLAHGVKKITAKHVRAGGLAAVIGLLGFMTGCLPNERENLMFPHRAMEIAEQASCHFVSYEELLDYKSR